MVLVRTRMVLVRTRMVLVRTRMVLVRTRMVLVRTRSDVLNETAASDLRYFVFQGLAPDVASLTSEVSGWGAAQRRATTLDLFVGHVFSHFLEEHELL